MPNGEVQNLPFKAHTDLSHILDKAEAYKIIYKSSSQHWKQKWIAVILQLGTVSSAYSYMIFQDVDACSVLQYNKLIL